MTLWGSNSEGIELPAIEAEETAGPGGLVRRGDWIELLWIDEEEEETEVDN